jgi:hypothetical protein
LLGQFWFQTTNLAKYGGIYFSVEISVDEKKKNNLKRTSDQLPTTSKRSRKTIKKILLDQ